MKQNQIVGLMGPGFTGMAVNHKGHVCLLAARSIAVCALATLCLAPAQAADTLPAEGSPDQATLAVPPADSPQGRQMERYKAFARQAPMPSMTVTDKTTLEIGGNVKTDLSRLAQLSTGEKAALASQFGVPAGIIGKVAERASTNPPPDAAQLAQDLRTAVIDYRFLQGEWERYHPPAEGQQTKADALAALQTGDIGKAWELYDRLQRPSAPPPPINPRIVAQ
jgi:hypothetical protein